MKEINVSVYGEIFKAYVPDGYAQIFDGYVKDGDMCFLPSKHNIGTFDFPNTFDAVDTYFCVIRPTESLGMTREEIDTIAGVVRDEICHLRENSGDSANMSTGHREWMKEHADYLEKTLGKLLKIIKP